MRAAVLGVEDFLIAKIKQHIETKGYSVDRSLSTEDVLSQAKPDVVFCQYWEDNSVWDAELVNRKLRSSPAHADVPLYLFCSGDLHIEAIKHFRQSQVISFANLKDLLERIGKTLEALTMKSDA